MLAPEFVKTQSMAAINTKKHEFAFTVTGNEAARYDSMTAAGPLNCHKENWFYMVAKDLLPAQNSTKVAISYHDVDGILGGAWLFTPALQQLAVTWVAKMRPLSQLLADLCMPISWLEAGRNTPISAMMSSLISIESLVSRCIHTAIV